MTLNILFPVLNEHLRLEKGIDRCVEYMHKNVSIPYKLTIVDNGSEAEHHAGDVTLRGSHALGNLFDDFIAAHLVVVDGLGLILAVRRERRLVFLNDFVFHIL